MVGSLRLQSPMVRRSLLSDGTESPMLDVIFIVAGLGFFAVAILYLAACDRL